MILVLLNGFSFSYHLLFCFVALFHRLVPLPGRVAFMSACSVFWNFYLSTSIGNQTPPIAIAANQPTDNDESEKASVAVASTSEV